MKSTKELQEIRIKDSKTLSAELKKLYDNLNDLKFSHAFRKVKNINEIKFIKKKIARVWTILGERIKERNV